MRFSVSAVVAVLLAGLCFSAFPQFSAFNFAHASSTLPVGDAEYSNGTLVPPHSALNVWYDWVNVSGTQVISYAEYTPSDYPYPGPIANIVGQHLQLEDGTEVFVASALTKFEVYRDLDGDGIPQANFTSGSSEILYYMYTNMSDSCNMSPIQMVLEDSVPHYQWGLSYQNVYGYLGIPSATGSWGGYAAKLIFDHITLNYDFSVNGNISNLKTSFDIGKVVSSNAINPAHVEVLNQTFPLDNLGLALLFTTSTYASKPYSTSVNGQPYNSTADSPATSVDLVRVAVGNRSAYDFVFGGNYTLNRGENNETHQANIETYEAKAEVITLTGLPIKIYEPALSQISWFRDYLNLTELFGGSWPDVAIDYNASSLIYRVCFPVWDGLQIVHDPVYVGYVANTAQVPEFPAIVMLPVFAMSSLLFLVLAKTCKRNHGKIEKCSKVVS